MIVWQCLAKRHGTASARKRHGCRCPEAVTAYRAANREFSRRRYIPGRACNRVGSWADPHIDEIAVERAIAGDLSVRLTRAERREAIDRLDARGLPAAAIARQLGMTTRTVTRQRARRRALTAPTSMEEAA